MKNCSTENKTQGEQPDTPTRLNKTIESQENRFQMSKEDFSGGLRRR